MKEPLILPNRHLPDETTSHAHTLFSLYLQVLRLRARKFQRLQLSVSQSRLVSILEAEIIQIFQTGDGEGVLGWTNDSQSPILLSTG